MLDEIVQISSSTLAIHLDVGREKGLVVAVSQKPCHNSHF